MPKKKERRHASDVIDVPLAIARLADAVQLLADAHSSGVQSSDRVATINELCDEVRDLAGVKDDESDATIDDSTSGGSGPRGE